MTDVSGVLSLRAARRYHWRLAGGRLIAGDGPTYASRPDRLERWRADTSWECRAEDVSACGSAGNVAGRRDSRPRGVVPGLERGGCGAEAGGGPALGDVGRSGPTGHATTEA